MLALTALALVATRTQLPAPFDVLEGAYPYGEQLCLVTTPDGTRTFTAVGAAIAILDSESTLGSAPISPLPVIDRVEIPDCAPAAIAYYHHPGVNPGVTVDSLYIAGGSLGLWRVSLCPSVLALAPATPTPCSSYAPQRLDRVGDPITPVDASTRSSVRRQAVCLVPGSERRQLARQREQQLSDVRHVRVELGRAGTLPRPGQ